MYARTSPALEHCRAGKPRRHFCCERENRVLLWLLLSPDKRRECQRDRFKHTPSYFIANAELSCGLCMRLTALRYVQSVLRMAGIRRHWRPYKSVLALLCAVRTCAANSRCFEKRVVESESLGFRGRKPSKNIQSHTLKIGAALRVE